MDVAVWLDNFFRKILPFFTCKVLFSKDERILEGGDIFLNNYWWLRSNICSQASYRYPILWEAFLDPSDSYFLFVDFIDFYTHWTYILYMSIFSHIFLSNYWWQKSDIWSQASYRYPISWEAFFDPSDSYILFAKEWGYHKWALAHSSSCSFSFFRYMLLPSGITVLLLVQERCCQVFQLTNKFSYHQKNGKKMGPKHSKNGKGHNQQL